MTRSLGGWDNVNKMKLDGSERHKSGQRILGKSDFVRDILSESEEQFSLKYKLKGLGYNFEKIVERVCKLLNMGRDYVTGKGRQNDRVRARDLLCYWAMVELGEPVIDLARKFDITPSATSYSVQRGEKLAKQEGYQCRLSYLII